MSDFEGMRILKTHASSFFSCIFLLYYWLPVVFSCLSKKQTKNNQIQYNNNLSIVSISFLFAFKAYHRTFLLVVRFWVWVTVHTIVQSNNRKTIAIKRNRQIYQNIQKKILKMRKCIVSLSLFQNNILHIFAFMYEKKTNSKNTKKVIC